MYIENFDKPLIPTNYLHTLYKQLAKKWGLSKSSIMERVKNKLNKSVNKLVMCN